MHTSVYYNLHTDTRTCTRVSVNAALGFVNTQQKVTKLRMHIHDIIPNRSTVLDFLVDGATFRVRSIFRTCFLYYRCTVNCPKMHVVH